MAMCASALPPDTAEPDEGVVVIREDMLWHAPRSELTSFTVMPGVSVEFATDVVIECSGPIVIQGELVGRRARQPERRHAVSVDAPSLLLVSRERLVVEGRVTGAPGLSGLFRPDAAWALPESAWRSGHVSGFEASVREALDGVWLSEGTALVTAPSQAFPGGAGGDVVLVAPEVVIDGRVEAGAGGPGGPAAPGGAGGDVLVYSQVGGTHVRDGDDEIVAGAGGDAGDPTVWIRGPQQLPAGGSGGDALGLALERWPGEALVRAAPLTHVPFGIDARGGHGGRGASGRHPGSPDTRVLARATGTRAAHPPGSILAFDSDGAAGSPGDDETGDAGVPDPAADGGGSTMSCAAGNGQTGGTGGTGGAASGSDGSVGGPGRSGCPDEPGKSGGKGGSGGKGTGGDGGDGGAGGPAFCREECPSNTAGDGGPGGPAGAGTGGDAGSGGNGGNGC